MKYLKKFESVESNLTEEYINNSLQILKDNGISYRIMPINSSKSNYRTVRGNVYDVVFENVFPDIQVFTDYTDKFSEPTLYLYESLKTIMDTLLLDGFASRYSSDHKTLKIFPFNTMYSDSKRNIDKSSGR